MTPFVTALVVLLAVVGATGVRIGQRVTAKVHRPRPRHLRGVSVAELLARCAETTTVREAAA